MRLLLLVCVLVQFGCQAERRDLGRPHIVLVVADTLRADHAGPWGAASGATPFLDELARRSLVFEDSTSTTSQTVPSVLSIWTGLYPAHHGNRYFPATNSFRVARKRVRPKVDEAVPLLSERLAAAGYATGAVVTNPWLQRRYGFDRGFDVYRALFRAGDLVRGAELNAVVAELLETAGARPLFLYLHYMDAHPPFDPAAEFRAQLMRGLEGQALDAINASAEGLAPEDIAYTRGMYAASVRELDERLRELFELFDARGLGEELLFVLVGDHGEEFAEHGGMGHGFQLFEESVRVPLLVSHAALCARRVAAPTSGVDVLPTLLDLLDLPVPEGLDGISLVPLMLGTGGSDAASERAIFSELGEQVATRRGPLKWIAHRALISEAELFDLAADPGEKRALAEAPPSEMHRAFESFVGSARPVAEEGDLVPQPLDPATEAQLRGLGYLEAE